MSRRYATFYYSAKPEWDAERYSAELDEIEAQYPKCVVCGERIHGDEVFMDEDGYKCERCMHAQYYVDMDSIMEVEE